MTESLPNKLSPLGPELMKLLQKKKEPSVAEKPAEPKKQRIITVIEAIEETPASASAPKTAAAKAAPAEASTFEVAAAEASNLENTLSDIDEMILNMAEEETAAAAEETLLQSLKKGRRCLEKRRSLPKMLRKKEISTFKT
jgi:phage-related minor tail protein